MKRLLLFCLAAMAFAACTKEQLPVADYDIIPTNRAFNERHSFWSNM